MVDSLAEVIRSLGTIQFTETKSQEVFDLVTRLAVAVVPLADNAVLEISRGRSPHNDWSVVATTEERYALLGCELAITAVSGGTQLRVRGDLGRWPEFAEQAKRLGIRDALCTPFPLLGGHHGCLTAYSLNELFGPEDEAALEVLVRHCSSTVANALAFEQLNRANEQLSEGLRSREVVGLAKGILMKEEQCSEEEAFQILVRGSQRLNRKVRDVAQHLVAVTEGRSELARGRRG